MPSKGCHLTPEAREKVAAFHRGRKLSPETCAKMSASHRGVKRDPEIYVKIAAANRGRRHTEETKAKQRGDRNHHWKGGRHVDADGYVHLRKSGHRLSDRCGYVYEHRLVMEQTLGRPLTPIEVVHHINGNPYDNRRENLALCQNQESHMAIHGGEICLPC